MKNSVENPIHLSTASLWPMSSFLSTKWSARVAERAGCEGLEILPGYSVVRGFEKNGNLSVPKSSIASFHDSWRRDRREVKEKGLLTDINANLSVLKKVMHAVNLACFPSEERCLQTVQGLEKFYGVPVIFHWPQDTANFKKRTLEVHPWIDKSPEELMHWVEIDPETRSLALDVSYRKFGEYLESQGISKGDRQKVFSQLLPFASEIHFQIGNKEELKQVSDRNYSSILGSAISEASAQGFEGAIVIEANPVILNKLLTPRFFSSVVDFIHASSSNRSFPNLKV